MQETTLIEKAQQGDTEAFRTLMESYQQQVFAFAYHLTGNSMDAEDLTQEVFIKVYHSLGSFERKAKFGTWLYRITLNCRINETKSKNARLRKNQIDLEAGYFLSGCDSENPEKQTEQSLFRDKLEQALNRLSPKERAIFSLRHFNEMKLEEIAGKLSISTGTVKGLHFRAIRKLQKALAAHQNG